MASADLYVFDGSSSSSSSSSIFYYSSPEMLSSDTIAATTTTTDPLFFCNSDLYPYLEGLNKITDPTDESVYDFESMALSQTLKSNFSDLSNGFPNTSAFDSSDIKTELLFDSSGYNQTCSAQSMAQSYSSVEENAGKYLQRSFSGNSGETKPRFCFNYPIDPLVESPNLRYQTLNSPENELFSGHMRRVYSTGDLQSMGRNMEGQRSYWSSSAMAKSSSSSSSSLNAVASFKVGRYSAEQRQERISKYRAKRAHRNFTKTIKYACRKTLADNRPRIRGRFARNDDMVETPLLHSSPLWNLEGLHEEEEASVDSFGQPHLQYTTSFW